MLLLLEHLISKARQKHESLPVLQGKPSTIRWTRMQGFAPIHRQELQWGLFSKLKGQESIRKILTNIYLWKCTDAHWEIKNMNWGWPVFCVECMIAQNTLIVFHLFKKQDDPVCVLLASVTVFSHWSFIPVRFSMCLRSHSVTLRERDSGTVISRELTAFEMNYANKSTPSPLLENHPIHLHRYVAFLFSRDWEWQN